MPFLSPSLPSGPITRSQSLRALAGSAFLGFSNLCPSLSAAEASALRLTFSQLAASPLIVPIEGARDPWREQLSPAIQAAEGKTIEITGYLLPLKIEKGRAKEFLLMRDQSGCCYGKTPAANEYLVSTAASGVPATMDIPVTVRGTLRIAPAAFDGVVTQFYTLENTTAVTP